MDVPQFMPTPPNDKKVPPSASTVKRVGDSTLPIFHKPKPAAAMPMPPAAPPSPEDSERAFVSVKTPTPAPRRQLTPLPEENPRRFGDLKPPVEIPPSDPGTDPLNMRRISSTDIRRLEERLSCNLPAVLKVIIPETSFVPLSNAVRVMDFSSGGCLVEMHERHTPFDSDAAFSTRFFELKIAHGEVPSLRGTVAWSDLSQKKPRFGLKFHKPVPHLVRILDPSGSSVVTIAPALTVPVLDPFPSTTLESSIVLRGSVKEAAEILINRLGGEESAVPVKNGRFNVELPLEEGSENLFFLRAIAGERRSRRLPVEITYISPNDRRSLRFDVSVKPGKEECEVLAMDYVGGAADLERILFQFMRVLSRAERATLSTKLTSNTGFVEGDVELLRQEGLAASSARKVEEDLDRLLDEFT